MRISVNESNTKNWKTSTIAIIGKMRSGNPIQRIEREVEDEYTIRRIIMNPIQRIERVNSGCHCFTVAHGESNTKN